MQRQHDVAIVGAGPAGSTLALLLARAGVDVVLVDRAHFPRAKACGDCLSAEATRVLDRLGVLPEVLACDPAQLRGWRIHGPRAAVFGARFEELGDPDPRVHRALALPRSRFDAVLLAAARAAGAAVLEGVVVTDLVREGGTVVGVCCRSDERELTLRARLTVGADGLRSRVARRLGAVARAPRLHKLSLTAHCAVFRDLAGFGEMHVGDGLCVGIAPVSGGSREHNITLVADSRRFGASVAADARAFFAAALRDFEGLHLGAVEPDALLASGPFDAPMRRIAFDGAVLLGDAAGYFDPFTGQGVYQALRSAELLAHSVLAALAQAPAVVGAAALAEYVRARRALTAGPRRVQRLIDVALARPASAERALRTLAGRPALARAIFAVTADLRPARSLLSLSLAASLLSPAAAQRA